MAKGMIRTVLGLTVIGAIVGGSIASYQNQADKAPVAKAQPKPQAAKSVNNNSFEYAIGTKVAVDAMDQGVIAYEAGDIMMACMQFGVATSAALSTKDVEAYKKTRALERKVCKEAGLTL
jgi:hypothetical protein